MAGRTSDVAILPLGPFSGAGAIEGAPASIDARCARLAWRPRGASPVCCARGARIDGRAKLEIARRAKLEWSDAGPIQDDTAPSGIVERLADVEITLGGERATACAALEDPAGGVDGRGCALRRGAREASVREDAWLLDDCALFPLDLRDGVLVPSARIDEALLVAAEHGPSLWDEARGRVAMRFGEEVAKAIDVAVEELRARRSKGIHLKTVK
jgi:hypothetical protein